jgi:hypothetical protein
MVFQICLLLEKGELWNEKETRSVFFERAHRKIKKQYSFSSEERVKKSKYIGCYETFEKKMDDVWMVVHCEYCR